MNGGRTFNIRYFYSGWFFNRVVASYSVSSMLRLSEQKLIVGFEFSVLLGIDPTAVTTTPINAPMAMPVTRMTVALFASPIALNCSSFSFISDSPFWIILFFFNCCSDPRANGNKDKETEKEHANTLSTKLPHYRSKSSDSANMLIQASATSPVQIKIKRGYNSSSRGSFQKEE